MSEEEQASIHLEEYSADWPSMFLQEKEILEGLIGAYLEGSIEHIGSTSVVGLVAKPVIDCMFGVTSLDSSRASIEILRFHLKVRCGLKGLVFEMVSGPDQMWLWNILN